MDTEQVNALVLEHIGIAEALARSLSGGPNGRDPERYEELHAQALLGLTKAAHAFDGRGDFAPFAVQRVRWFLASCYEAEQKHAGGVSLDAALNPGAVASEGHAPTSLHGSLADRRCGEPAEELAAREALAPRKGRRSVVSEVRVRTPVPQTGAWVAELRKACFDAVSPADMADVMKAVVKRAKKGNVAATKLLLDYLCGGKGGQVTQAVVVQDEADFDGRGER